MLRNYPQGCPLWDIESSQYCVHNSVQLSVFKRRHRNNPYPLIPLSSSVIKFFSRNMITGSRNVQDYFQDVYGRKTHYIPNGVNRPEKKNVQEIEKKYGLKKDEYILFVARLVPEKGLHYLIEAFRKIDTDKKLVVAGGSSHSFEYMESSEYNGFFCRTHPENNPAHYAKAQ